MIGNAVSENCEDADHPQVCIIVVSMTGNQQLSHFPSDLQ